MLPAQQNNLLRLVFCDWPSTDAAHRRVCVSQAPGGEDLLLDEFEGLGLHCEPSTQLVVTCEVCGRPSTKDCWTCGMRICDFCTLKRHWKVCPAVVDQALHGAMTFASMHSLARKSNGRFIPAFNEGIPETRRLRCDETHAVSMQQDSFALHWPLVNSDHMRTRLAKRELEKKRIEDAHRCCKCIVPTTQLSSARVSAGSVPALSEFPTRARCA